MPEDKFKSKTPLDSFFTGFKIVSAQIGYLSGGLLIGYGLIVASMFMILLGGLIIFLSYEINKSLLAESKAKMAALKAVDEEEKEDQDDNDDIGPLSPA